MKQAVGEVNRTKVKHVISGIPPTDFMTYMKDRLNMSTHMMTELRLWPELDDILPKSELDDIVKQIASLSRFTCKAKLFDQQNSVENAPRKQRRFKQ